MEVDGELLMMLLEHLLNRNIFILANFLLNIVLLHLNDDDSASV